VADLIAIGYDDMTTAEQALGALAPSGGTVIKTSLSKDVEEELQRELHGEAGA
jgi:uncharacterized membrane protein